MQGALHVSMRVVAYLKATFEALANGHPQNKLDALLPRNFQTST